MITDSNDYLAQLAAITSGSSSNKSIYPKDEPYVDIDNNARIIDTCNVLDKFVIVQSDHKSETIFFKVNRFFDDVDLTQKSIIIKYQPSYSTKVFYDSAIFQTDEKLASDGKLVFGWELSDTVTQQDGDVLFQIMFYSLTSKTPSYIDYSLNTTINKLHIERGLNVI